MNLIEMLSLLIQDAFWAGLAALGFAILFNTPPKYLLVCTSVGAFSHAVRFLIMQFGVPIEFATLGAAMLVGFIAMYLARRLHSPATIFAVVGVIPMIPGSFAYRTMLSVVSIASAAPDQTAALLTEASTNAIKTGLILAALGIGIAAPPLLFQREKPVV